jgi:hypothetical protein
MVKFRALLGEACLHKKISESAVPTSRNWNKTNDTVLKKILQGKDASGNLKKHEKICQRPKKLHFCPYCAKQFKLNWLVIRHEKGCQDRPG